MKKLLIITSFLFASFLAQSQDLIITTLQDSISGEILKSVNNKLYYKTINNNELLFVSIELSELKDTIPNFYIQDIQDTALLKKLHSDYIITREAQLIYCNINKLDTKEVLYSEIIHGQEVHKSMPTYSVYNYVSLNKNTANSNIVSQTTKGKVKDTTYKKFKLMVTGGYASRNGKMPPNIGNDELNYLKDLNTGYFYGVSAGFYFNPNWGVGLKFSGFNSKSTGKLNVQDDEGNNHRVPIVSNLKMNFFGPVVNYRIISPKNNTEVVFGISLGKLYYNDIGNINGIYTKMTSETIGVGMEVTGTYFVTESFGLSLHANLLSGSFSNMYFIVGDYSDKIVFEDDARENAGRYEIGAGLVWAF